MSDQSSSKSNYGFFPRLLHKLVLEYPFVAETIFDIEQAAARRKSPRPTIRPVFIAGLARSGTTALLTSIYETGEFKSLTYKDMPFVLAPSFWKKASGRKAVDERKIERAHGDGILVNAESPEAFEEIFWRTFCHKNYIHKQCLSPHKVDEETLGKFRLFVSSVIQSADDPRQTRYLSKNNNNLLRLPTIKKAFPDAIMIIPFRDPVQQSISLMNQHRVFCQLHAQDGFSLKYMNWLAHHEFGLGHKPFQFENSGDDMTAYHPGEINYWLTIWNSTYQYILKTASANDYFLGFERLCKHTTEEIIRMYTLADIPIDNILDHSAFKSPPLKTIESAESSLVAKCNQTYQKLLQRNNPG